MQKCTLKSKAPASCPPATGSSSAASGAWASPSPPYLLSGGLSPTCPSERQMSPKTSSSGDKIFLNGPKAANGLYHHSVDFAGAGFAAEMFMGSRSEALWNRQLLSFLKAKKCQKTAKGKCISASQHLSPTGSGVIPSSAVEAPEQQGPGGGWQDFGTDLVSSPACGICSYRTSGRSPHCRSPSSSPAK